MSITASQKARLGVFLSIGVFLLLVFLAIPLGFKINTKFHSYHAYFTGQSISGVEEGADVKYNGVRVGKVEGIEYVPEDLTKVRINLKIEDNFPVKADMELRMSGMNITGIQHLELSGGSNESQHLEPGSEITTKPSLMNTITGKSEIIIEKVELLLNHLNKITHPDSLVGVKSIITNVDQITADAAQFINALGPDLQQSAHAFQDIVVTVDSISRDMKSITGELRRSFSSSKINTILASVDTTTRSIQMLTDDMSLIVHQSREDIMVSLENLREAVENANQLTKILSENPSLLLRGEQQKERVIR